MRSRFVRASLWATSSKRNGVRVLMAIVGVPWAILMTSLTLKYDHLGFTIVCFILFMLWGYLMSVVMWRVFAAMYGLPFKSGPEQNNEP